LVLSYALLQVWGLPGLAVAVPLAYVFYALLMLPVTHKLVGHRWSREVGQLLGWSAILVAAGFAANRLLPPAAAVLCGAALMWHLDMFDAQILAQNVMEGANSFPLLAVPFFMLAGEVMNAGGLSRRIVNFALSLVGHVRGGLGYVAIVAAVMMAALSCSAVADAAALSALLLPMMALLQCNGYMTTPLNLEELQARSLWPAGAQVQTWLPWRPS
jgi:hypothetical protein